MNPILKGFYAHFVITQTFVFNGSQEELTAILNRMSMEMPRILGFKIALDSDNVYVASPLISWGTSSPGMGIKVYLKRDPLNQYQQQIKFYTSLRLEVILLLAFFPFAFFGIPSPKDNVWSKVFIPVIFMVAVVWFNFVAKLQEHSLIKNIRKRIPMSEQI